MIAVGSFEEAIAAANDAAYGLAASIFTANGKQALRGVRMLRAGTVTANSFGGRDNAIHLHDQYTQLRTIWLGLTDTFDIAMD